MNCDACGLPLETYVKCASCGALTNAPTVPHDDLLGLTYVDITTPDCDKWLNLFLGEDCIALVDNQMIADRIRRIASERKPSTLSTKGE